jgi:tetratricopeptide (TPR) repeat protein
MSFLSLRGRSQLGANFAGHSERAVHLQMWLVSALFVTVAPQMSHAQDHLPAAMRSAEAQLEDGRTTLDEHTLMAAKRSFEDCTREDPKNSRCYYGLGRTDSYLADVRERQGDKKAAQQAIEAAIENTRDSIDLKATFADAHALLAELYGKKIGYGGLFTGMRLGPKAEAETQKALEEDSNDPRIYVVIGRRQLYSPRMFGGDIEKAIESFRKATTVDPHYDEGFVWLAIAYSKKGDSIAAKAAVDEALRLNNRNVIATEIRAAMR